MWPDGPNSPGPLPGPSPALVNWANKKTIIYAKSI